METYEIFWPVSVRVIDQRGEEVRSVNEGRLVCIRVEARSMEEAEHVVGRCMTDLILDEREGYIVKKDVP